MSKETSPRTFSRLYPLSKYTEALKDKEQSGGIMRKIYHRGLDQYFYEVIYLPPEKSPYIDYP